MRAKTNLVVLMLCGVTATSVGCNRHAMRLPGVVDMRTDGTGAEPGKVDLTTVSQHVRPEFSGLMEGEGIGVRGPEITVEDRAYWLIRVIPVYNNSIDEELQGMLEASGGGVRNLHLGEEFMFIDWALSVVAQFIFPLTAWVLPPFTAQVSGLPLKLKRNPKATPRRQPKVPSRPRDPSATGLDAAPPPLLDAEPTPPPPKADAPAPKTDAPVAPPPDPATEADMPPALELDLPAPDEFGTEEPQ